MLPSEIKRNFDLMRELDKVAYPQRTPRRTPTDTMPFPDVVPAHRGAARHAPRLPAQREGEGGGALRGRGPARADGAGAARAGRGGRAPGGVGRDPRARRAEAGREDRHRGAVVRRGGPPHPAAGRRPRGLRGAAARQRRVRGGQEPAQAPQGGGRRGIGSVVGGAAARRTTVPGAFDCGCRCCRRFRRAVHSAGAQQGVRGLRQGLKRPCVVQRRCWECQWRVEFERARPRGVRVVVAGVGRRQGWRDRQRVDELVRQPEALSRRGRAGRGGSGEWSWW